MYKIGWANRVTLARLFLIAPFVVCLLNLNDASRASLRWIAVGIFALMAVSDWIDGFLARRFHDESPLGAFLDPLADKLLVTFALVILCIRGIQVETLDGVNTLTLPNWVVVLAIGKDLLVSIGFLVVYLTTKTVYIKPRQLGKWCTTVELLLVLAVLIWPSLPAALALLPQGLWIAVAVLAVLSTLDYIRAGNAYIMSFSAERRPPGEDRP
jgi:CDP-diacylglycerol--glycerol-3-phosphate 3-phosphatidyltransferase